jgi:hypothetical protein
MFDRGGSRGREVFINMESVLCGVTLFSRFFFCGGGGDERGCGCINLLRI